MKKIYSRLGSFALVVVIGIAMITCDTGSSGGGTDVATPDLEFTLIDNGTAYSVSKGTISDTNVVIPDEYNGLPVKQIAENGFSKYEEMTSITIHNSVTSIGEDAFYYCTGLTNITIPNSVTSIGDSAFFGCTGLTSITIPISVTSIGGQAFSYCSGLTSVTVKSGNTVYRSEGNCLIQIVDDILILGCINSVIPNSVTGIGDCAFQGCTGMTSITIPNSVTSIGEAAFYDCIGLTSITIPNNVTIGYVAFFNCTGLTSVTMGNNITSIGEAAFPGNLSEVYFASGGGAGTYTITSESETWTKQ